MATVEARPSRKRKAGEAEIESRGPNDLKRLKLDCAKDATAEQIKKAPENVPVTDTSSSTAAPASDPFAAFADFSSKSESKQEQSKSKSPEDFSAGWPDMASNGGGFGSFDSAAAPDAQSSWGQATEFKFGADDADFDLTKIVASPPKKEDAAAAAVDSEQAGADEVIAQLTGAVDSGDALDHTVHRLTCTVYELDAEVNRYKEKGVGEVKLNTYTNEDNERLNARLLCRQQLTFKTLINSSIQSDTAFVKVNERNVRFTVFEQLLQPKADDDKDKQEAGDKDQAAEAEAEAPALAPVTVTKTYLLKLKEPGKGKIDQFIAKVHEIQTKM